MKVLITGGAGYVGTELVYKLASSDDVSEVVVYDNLNRGNYNLFIGHSKLSRKVRFIKADILDSRTFSEALNGIDVVYHLAAKVFSPFSDHEAHVFEQINHWGTAEVTYAVEKSEVRKIIYTSSVSIYGESIGHNEVNSVGVTPSPKTFYGISKYKGESKVARLVDHGKDVYIFRLGNIYGYSKSMRFDSVINRFMFDANYNGCLSVHGSGDQGRPFTCVEKAVDVLSKVVCTDLRSGIYDLVEDNLEIKFIAETIQRLFRNLDLIYIDQDLRLGELRVRINEEINNISDVKYDSLYEKLLGFRENFTF